MNERRFHGKFRGRVTDNQDPLQIGRIRASVPDVLGDAASGWAMPCFPFAGQGLGFFALPDVGAGVWIEFEHGDPDFPIWAGCWYGTAAELPPALLAPPYQKLIVKTKGGNSVTLDDTPGVGGITLETPSGAKLTLSATGVELTNGLGATIQLTGPQVSVNNGALDIL
ncbi:MAG: phage baseplate assembly protein V [Verrucomicrobiota bacterium]|jgi:uncharacterized protein involved in type VI secretion and phage assembly